ncbi:hypothetical protein ACWCSD_40585 [Nonomuraea sp. NPDC001684]
MRLDDLPVALHPRPGLVRHVRPRLEQLVVQPQGAAVLTGLERGLGLPGQFLGALLAPATCRGGVGLGIGLLLGFVGLLRLG